MNENKLIIYHNNCNDGFCAAWLFNIAFPGSKFYAANYGEAPPYHMINEKTEIYIADFSYKRDVMEKLTPNLRVVLEHHETAEKELKDFNKDKSYHNIPSIIFAKDKSGARLTFDFLHHTFNLPFITAPWLVDYTEDADLYNNALPNTFEINASLRSYEMSFAEWNNLSYKALKDLIPEGKAILRREKQIIDERVKNAIEIEFAGYKVLCVNAITVYSQVATVLAQGRSFGMTYFDRKDGKRQYSLRSTNNGINVAELAARHGGGGHAHAAGFEVAIFGPLYPIKLY